MPRKWRINGDDEDHLPEGLRRVGYDADTGKYTYETVDGSEQYEGQPGQRYGELTRTRTRTTQPVRTTPAPTQVRSQTFQPQPPTGPSLAPQAARDPSRASLRASPPVRSPVIRPSPQDSIFNSNTLNSTNISRNNTIHNNITDNNNNTRRDGNLDDFSSPVPSNGARTTPRATPTPPPAYRTPPRAPRAMTTGPGTTSSTTTTPSPPSYHSNNSNRRALTFSAILAPAPQPPIPTRSKSLPPIPATRTSSPGSSIPSVDTLTYPRQMEVVPARVPELQLTRCNPNPHAGAAASAPSKKKKKRTGSFVGAMWGLGRNALGFVREAAISKAEKWSEGLKMGKEEMKARRKERRRRGEDSEREDDGKDEWI